MELTKRNSNYTIDANHFTQHSTEASTISYPGATKENPLGIHLNEAIAHAKELARKRGMKVPATEEEFEANSKRVSIVNDVQPPFIDNEMVNFHYADDEIEGTISATGVRLEENTTGFGSKVLDDEMAATIHHLKENEIPVLDREEDDIGVAKPQQPTGLRKFGSLKGK